MLVATYGSKEPCLDGVQIPHWKSQLKIVGSLLCSKRGHLALSNGTLARLLQSTAILPTDRCYITLFPHEKSTLTCSAAFCQNSLTTCFCKYY